jgi:hypothetical protein
MLLLPELVALKVGVTDMSGLLKASLSVIIIVDVVVPSAVTGPVPMMVEFAGSAAPALKVTVVPVFETGVRISRVLTSALVDLSEQLDKPVAKLALQPP